MKDTIPDSIHNKALEHLKTYFLIGGMPEVIKTYIQSNSLLEADKIKYSILNTFRDDFSKYKNRQILTNLQEVFDRLGIIVGKNKGGYPASTIIKSIPNFGYIKNWLVIIYTQSKLFMEVLSMSFPLLLSKPDVLTYLSKSMFETFKPLLVRSQ